MRHSGYEIIHPKGWRIVQPLDVVVQFSTLWDEIQILLCVC